MAVADYFARTAVAASQVLNGFDEERFRDVLQDLRVGIAIGSDASESAEGCALVDMIIRLVSRLYPVLVIRSGSEMHAKEVCGLATRINPKIEFGSDATVEIVVGSGLPPPTGVQSIFVGSDAWNAFVGTAHPLTIGKSDNPFGPGAAA